MESTSKHCIMLIHKFTEASQGYRFGKDSHDLGNIAKQAVQVSTTCYEQKCIHLQSPLSTTVWHRGMLIAWTCY